MLRILKAVIPSPIAALLRIPYHFLLQFGAALITGFPARAMIVIGVTGTKGKSTTCDMLYHTLKSAGYPTALASTIRYVTPASEEPNKFKMTMQGRGFIQFFLARARKEGATHVVVELSSEGAAQYRHLFLSLNVLIVTGLHKEHIESHGSFDKYVKAKRQIVYALERSWKKNKLEVINTDSAEPLRSSSVRTVGYSAADLPQAPMVPLDGEFNRLNALAAAIAAEHVGAPAQVVRAALSVLPPVRGRVEHIDIGPAQKFLAIVDYAHTPDSLRALYGAFSTQKKICVLGNTGGGRDKWKRPEMGTIADELCDTVILTNEDPYDEDPEVIVKEMAAAMKRTPTIIMDRRSAIAEALRQAQGGNENVAVLISGKGTDPYIMEAKGKKTVWSDAVVVREELEKLLPTTN
ncbi:MAG: Mur ligase family protein [Patescibacteria group bacterium]